MVIWGWWCLPGVNPVFLASAHLTPLIILWWPSKPVDGENQTAIAAYDQQMINLSGLSGNSLS